MPRDGPRQDDNISLNRPPPKERKRANAGRLWASDEVLMSPHTFPPTSERQELAVTLSMTSRSVQIWHDSGLAPSTAHLVFPLGSKTSDSQRVTCTRATRPVVPVLGTQIG